MYHMHCYLNCCQAKKSWGGGGGGGEEGKQRSMYTKYAEFILDSPFGSDASAGDNYYFRTYIHIKQKETKHNYLLSK